MQISTRKSILGAAIPFLMLFFMATTASAQPWSAKADEEFLELKHEVGARLLLQTLELTKDQKAQWIKEQKQLRKLKKELEEGLTEHRDKMKNHMKSLNKTLKKGEKPDQDQQAATMKEMMEERNQLEPYRSKMEGYLKAMIDILTPEQKDRLQRFNPQGSLGMGSPFADDPPQNAAEILDRIRTLSDDVWAMHKQRMQKRGRRGGQQAGRVCDMLEQVRDMSEADYLQRRDELAAQLPDRMVQRLSNGGGFGARQGKAMMGRGKGRRGMGPGMGRGGMGQGMGQGMGPGMGSGGMGQGMGPGAGFGGADTLDDPPPPEDEEFDAAPRFARGRFHEKKIRMLLLTDAFWKVLNEN